MSVPTQVAAGFPSSTELQPLQPLANPHACYANSSTRADRCNISARQSGPSAPWTRSRQSTSRIALRIGRPVNRLEPGSQAAQAAFKRRFSFTHSLVALPLFRACPAGSSVSGSLRSALRPDAALRCLYVRSGSPRRGRNHAVQPSRGRTLHRIGPRTRLRRSTA